MRHRPSSLLTLVLMAGLTFAAPQLATADDELPPLPAANAPQESEGPQPTSAPPRAPRVIVLASQPVPAQEPETRWYGWQTLVADGVSLATFIGGAFSEALVVPGGLLALGGYALGGPAVHWSHGHVGRGFLSMGLRVGGMLGGAALGVAMAGVNRGGDVVGYTAAIFGLTSAVLGMAGAITMDAAWLSWEDVPRERSSPEASTRARETRLRAAHPVRLVPTLDVSPARVQAGVGGTF